MKIFKTLKSSKMKIWNIWSWPASVIDDIRQWQIVRKSQKEAEVINGLKSFKYEIRTDKIGRMYTVINIPEELVPYEKRDMVWPWMLEQLRELDDLLMSLRLNDLVYPEVTQIEGTSAYLVVLSPSTDSISIWKFLRWILNVSFVSLFFFILNSLSNKFLSQSIVSFLIDLF